MADRQQGDDVRWLVQAMEINREVGGDLAEVLDNVATTVRERTQLQRHVQAVSAEGRLSAYVLVALPIVLSAGLAAINPTYFSTLTHGIGLVLVGVGAVMLTIGSVILNRMVKIDL
jgi:tight adherence protein B